MYTNLTSGQTKSIEMQAFVTMAALRIGDIHYSVHWILVLKMDAPVENVVAASTPLTTVEWMVCFLLEIKYNEIEEVEHQCFPCRNVMALPWIDIYNI